MCCVPDMVVGVTVNASGLVCKVGGRTAARLGMMCAVLISHLREASSGGVACGWLLHQKPFSVTIADGTRLEIGEQLGVVPRCGTKAQF